MHDKSHAPEEVWTRERDFHDALARDLQGDELGRTPSDRLDAALLQISGDVTDLTVLDAGCGQGDLTLRLLEEGARVTALDVSGGMIEVARGRADQLSAAAADRLATVVAPLEQAGLPDGVFDLAVGKFILHHVDVAPAASELRRMLRPGGRAVFIENWGENPLLAFAREHFAGRWGIPRLGTEDEHPLRLVDVQALEGVFSRVTTHYPVFEFLVLFDRQVLRFRFPRISRVIRWLDDAVYRHFPALRRFSYRVIVELETGP